MMGKPDVPIAFPLDAVLHEFARDVSPEVLAAVRDVAVSEAQLRRNAGFVLAGFVSSTWDRLEVDQSDPVGQALLMLSVAFARFLLEVPEAVA